MKKRRYETRIYYHILYLKIKIGKIENLLKKDARFGLSYLLMYSKCKIEFWGFYVVKM